MVYVSPFKVCRVLRLSAAIGFLIAGFVMTFCVQKAEVSSIKFVAKSRHWPGFWFFVIVNFAAFFYNFVVLWIPEGSPDVWKRVAFVDLMISTLMSGLIGVGWQTYSLFVEGSADAFYANWSPICGGNDVLKIFCLRYFVSLISSTVGFSACFAILVLSFNALLSH